MTKEEFDFWEKAFLAAMQGFASNPNCDEQIAGYARGAELLADAALAVWREKRAEMVTTNSPYPFCHAPGDCLCEERKGA